MGDGIPGPKGWPFLGNALDIDLEFPLGSFTKFADDFGWSSRQLAVPLDVQC